MRARAECPFNIQHLGSTVDGRPEAGHDVLVILLRCFARKMRHQSVVCFLAGYDVGIVPFAHLEIEVRFIEPFELRYQKGQEFSKSLADYDLFQAFADKETGNKILFGQCPEVVADLLCRPGRIKSKTRIQSLCPGIAQPRFLSQYLVPARCLHLLSHAVPDRKGSAEISKGLLPAQIGHDGPVRQFFLIDDPFQAQPEQI